MIRALARLHRLRPDAPLILRIVGEPLSELDKNYVAECRALAATLGIEELVEWVGPVAFAAVHAAYRCGDIFLSANDNGLDKAILEAMASGLPVIAMHPALKAPLGEYYAGDEQAFGDALISLAELDKSQRGEIGVGLRRYVEREHSLEQLGRRVAAQLRAMAR